MINGEIPLPPAPFFFLKKKKALETLTKDYWKPNIHIWPSKALLGVEGK